MKIFCWDFDMTLAYPRLTKRSSVVEALREYVHTLDAETAEAIKSRLRLRYPWNTSDPTLSRLRGEAAWDCIRRQIYDAFIACGVDDMTASEAAGAARAAIADHRRYCLYPDAADTLRYVIARGARNVLLTNNYPELPEIVEALGIAAYFDEMIISDLVGCSKPHREIFDIARACFPGAHFYMVGDSAVNDIEGGRRAGFTTVLVHAERSRGADYCFDDLAQITTLL